MAFLIGYCSWCYAKTSHRLVQKNNFRRNVYECACCKGRTLKCRRCDAMARGRNTSLQAVKGYGDGFAEGGKQVLTSAWDNELCAEHNGTILSFVAEQIKLNDFDESWRIFKKNSSVSHTLKTIGRLTAGSASKLMPLRHAVKLTAGGLALPALLLVGGGLKKWAAGEYGTIDEEFDVKKLNDIKSNNKTVFINGFLQKNDKYFCDWIKGQNAYNTDYALYGVNWASSSMQSALANVGSGFASKALLSLVLQNDWHGAMSKAQLVGLMLAKVIVQTKGLGRVNLVGHSLGCRVIYYTLVALAKESTVYVNDVILLGGAVDCNDDAGWRMALSATSGVIHNCYSAHDGVLKFAYQGSNLGFSRPIGINKINLKIPSKRLRNHCFDDVVKSHFDWKMHYLAILKVIYG